MRAILVLAPNNNNGAGHGTDNDNYVEATVATIQIDVTHPVGIELDEYMRDLLDGTGVTFDVVQAVSSAGGWPLVELTGPRMALAYVVAVYAGPNGDAEWLIGQIKD